MRPGLKTLGLFLAALVLAAASGSTAQAPAPLTNAASTPADFSFAGGESLRSLDGQWRFHPGDDPRWADPAFDDSHWSLLRSDRPWTAQGVHNAGPAWYRLAVRGVPSGKSMAIMFPAIDAGYDLFAGGRLIGTVKPTRPGYVLRQTLPEAFSLPPGKATDPPTLVLALRVWVTPFSVQFGAGPEEGGAAIGSPDLIGGRMQELRDRRTEPIVGNFLAICLDILVGCVMLALGYLRKSERLYLRFAAALFCQAVLSILTTTYELTREPLLPAVMAIECMVTLTLIVSLVFFSQLFRAPRGLVWKLCFGLCFLPMVVCAFWISGLLPPLSASVAEALALGGISVWLLFLLLRRAFQGDPDARLLVVPVAFLFGVHIVEPLLGLTWSLGLQHIRPTISTIAVPVGPFAIGLFALAEILLASSLLVFLVRRFVLSRAHEDRIASELEAAREVQHVLVPETLPATPGLTIQTAYHPAQEVGGDFFQILPLASGATLVVIGDVAGKGMPAALTVSLAVGTLRTLADYTDSPAAILAGLNRRLHDRGTGFTTCLALRFDPPGTVHPHGGRSLTLANAGHLPPYLNGHELFTEPNLPLGLDPYAQFAETIHALQLADHLAVLTDGVPEAMHGRELFGFERTAELSRAPATEIAHAARGFGQADDITVLTVDLVPVPAASAVNASPVLQPARG